MPNQLHEPPAALLVTRPSEPQQKKQPAQSTGSKGFGGGSVGGSTPAEGRSARIGKRKKSQRNPALSKGDWGPLGKHPDREAIVARQRLHLQLSGRLTADQVNQAWKRSASENHPDRGGEHDTMQLVNAARDLLLGRDLS